MTRIEKEGKKEESGRKRLTGRRMKTQNYCVDRGEMDWVRGRRDQGDLPSVLCRKGFGKCLEKMFRA